MSEFKSADLIALDINDTAEGIYAGSGSLPNIPQETTPDIQNDDTWRWECRWDGHNSGGHSVCHFQGTHRGRKSGNHLELHVTTNFPIKEVKNASGLTITNVGLYNFTLIRNNHFNPSESVGFNAEIITSELLYDENNNPLHGAIGTNNAGAKYCNVAVTVSA